MLCKSCVSDLQAQLGIDLILSPLQMASFYFHRNIYAETKLSWQMVRLTAYGNKDVNGPCTYLSAAGIRCCVSQQQLDYLTSVINDSIPVRVMSSIGLISPP